ncbi:sensor histidine kinase [Sunxiuqinia sp. A32]|uniref:sensor histidine kinase n=1 Tax=Sunxiuqinia sp. A32 TaxID=3461496 RepID=UPI0040463C2E
MARTIAKISIALLIIVSLPLGFYLTRELTTLNENEKMVERVFSSQLETILLSLNQYSESLVSRWGYSLDQPVDAEGPLMHAIVNNLLQNNPSIERVNFAESGKGDLLVSYDRSGVAHADFNKPSNWQINNLRNLLGDNFQKIESLIDGNKVLFFFLMKSTEGNTLCQLVINPKVFVEQSLGPQIQQVSQDIFYIEVRDTLNDALVYTVDNIDEREGSIETLPLWYLPNYQFGIRLKSKTVTELASERSQQSSLILWGLTVVVILGLGFVIWNIRKEMKLAELKSEFVSNVSHEIRTPLALISMYAETLLLKRVKTEEKKAEYLETIFEESNRLTGIVNRILNFSRIEKNKRSYDFREVDLIKLVEASLRTCKNHFESKNVECKFKSPDKPMIVVADREAVSDMLMNLMDNAVKYGKDENKQITIRLATHKKQVWLEVEDNGIGISLKDQKYIFDQFYRVTEGKLANKAKGSGLGLNMVLKMMKAHGGGVSVKSKVGEGSTFILKFPVKQNNHV